MCVARAAVLCALLSCVAGTTLPPDEAESSSSEARPSSTPPAPTVPPPPPGAPEGAAGGAVGRAVRYLLARRAPDWGWGNDTAAVILALQFANSSGKEVDVGAVAGAGPGAGAGAGAGAGPGAETAAAASLEVQLSIKQMDIEILLMLAKQHESAGVPPLARLAGYALALGALCRDPRAFHQRDLLAALLHRDPPHDRDFALAALAACSSAAHVRRRHIRRLLDIANAAADHNLETISLVILALRCIVQDHRHRDLLHFVRRPLAGLARQQQPDGGFGTLSATALAIQALEHTESTGGGGASGGGGGGAVQYWNRSAARSWLLSRQHEDGGWGDVAGDVADTAAAVCALSAGRLAAVRPPHCRDKLLESRHDATDAGADGALKLSFPAGAVADESDARNVSFTYTLWIGSNVTENYTLYMVAPRNISFYRVMQLAAEQEPRFRFSASEWPNGHYVHTLAERREEPMAYRYWLLYRLAEPPDPATPPGNQLVAPVGVDDLLVEEGEHYLFWYKKL